MAQQGGPPNSTGSSGEKPNTILRIAHQVGFSDLVGRWTPDPGLDEVIAAQRQVNWDRWK